MSVKTKHAGLLYAASQYSQSQCLKDNKAGRVMELLKFLGLSEREDVQAALDEASEHLK